MQEKEWYGKVKDFKESGKNQKALCRENGVKRDERYDIGYSDLMNYPTERMLPLQKMFLKGYERGIRLTTCCLGLCICEAAPLVFYQRGFVKARVV